jgi:hypothetical protein
MPDEQTGFVPDPGAELDLGLRQPDPRFRTGVQNGWHAIDAEPYFPGCGEHAGALCSVLVRVAGERFQPYNPSSVPVSYDPCPVCRWTVAAVTDDYSTALAELGHPLARSIATAILDRSGRLEQGVDDPATVQLLAHVSRHAPIALVAEACSEGDCEHVANGDEPGKCPDLLACKACSLQAGSWAGEWEGQYRPECLIEAPCAVLLALGKSAGVTP